MPKAISQNDHAPMCSLQSVSLSSGSVIHLAMRSEPLLQRSSGLVLSIGVDLRGPATRFMAFISCWVEE